MPEQTIRRIERILQDITTHPEFSNQILLKQESFLRKEAHHNSLKIEEEAHDDTYRREESGKTYRKQQTDFHNLNRARKFLLEKGLNLTTLSQLGYIIEPEVQTKPTFRRTTVQFGEFIPCSFEKIDYELENMIYTTENSKVHPILKAINAHIDMVKIHPYVDGNGRAARLVQNVLLEENEFPVPIIPYEERELYIDLLGRTLKDRYNLRSYIENPSSDEQTLHKFLVGKIYRSSVAVIKELEKHRQYAVSLYDVEKPGVVHTISRKIKSESKRQGRDGVKVKISNKNNGRKKTLINVNGDLSKNDLERILRGQVDRGIKDFEIS